MSERIIILLSLLVMTLIYIPMTDKLELEKKILNKKLEYQLKEYNLTRFEQDIVINRVLDSIYYLHKNDFIDKDIFLNNDYIINKNLEIKEHLKVTYLSCNNIYFNCVRRSISSSDFVYNLIFDINIKRDDDYVFFYFIFTNNYLKQNIKRSPEYKFCSI